MLFDLIKMYVAKSMTKILQCKERYVLELNNLCPPMRAFFIRSQNILF